MSATTSPVSSAALSPADGAGSKPTALQAKLQPLLDGGRLDNLVDLLSLLSDLVDFADAALIEKLSKTLEELIAVSTAAGGALRIATAQARREADAPPLRSLWSIARDPDTRRGLAMVLRVLQITGRMQRESSHPRPSPGPASNITRQ